MRMITRTITDFSDLDFELGEVILIDKEINKPSFNLIYKLRKTIGIKKIGHAGTLDPKATGLMIICTGKKTKEIESFQNLIKTYEGVITIGKTTVTMDAESEVIEEKNFIGITEEKIISARSSFLGKIQQIPPMYSAVKHKGKSLYKYARKGIEVERKAREVSIFRFDITKINLPEIYFEIDCSKGTYIRVLANDFGCKLGCGAFLSSLRRTGIGSYKVKDALRITEFIKLYEESAIKIS
jgi:tRNA pseudouridine55 synthase